MNLQAKFSLLLLFAFFLGAKAQCPADFSPLPNENSCASFYNCSTGEKILENCPPGTYYNCMTQTCGTKTFNFCCPASDTSIYFDKNGVNFPCLNGTVAGDYKYEDIYYTCVNGAEILTGQCDTGYSYCEASRSCYIKDNEACTSEVDHVNTMQLSSVADSSWISQAPWAICPTDGSNFNDPKNCSVFYNCSSGVPNLFECPEGYFYDCFNDACTTFSNWYCCNLDETIKPSALLKTSMYKCKNGKNTYLDGYENTFLECQNNNILTGFCGNLSFCNTTKSCYDPSTSNCTRSAISQSSQSSATTTVATTSSTTQGTSNTSSGIPSKCFNTSVTGVYNDCTKYTYFNSSGSYTFQCKSNLYFNSFKKCCLTSTEIFTPACSGAPNQPPISNNSCLSPGKNVENLQSCDSFFTCNGSYQIQAQTCSSGQLFDWKLGKCTSALSANVVPGCTTSKYNQCLSSDNFRGQICKFVTWAPKFIFKNLGDFCKGLICRVTWFV